MGVRTANGSPELAIFTEAMEWGGTERVVQALADRFPSAPIIANHFSSLTASDVERLPWTGRARLVPSGRRKRHFLGPLYARRLADTPVGAPQVVLTLASAGWALAAPVPPGGRHVCYLTGPPLPLYGETDLYLQNERAPLRPFLRASVPALRAYYRRLIRRPHRLVSVSRAAVHAIAQVYGREAEVVHPPVRTGFFTPANGSARPRHFLAVSRLVPQKRLDVLIDAFSDLDETLVIAGGGPWLDRLRSRATANVRFTGWVDDLTLRELLRSSRALLCPSVEDFGIVMAEAHACGVPVIAPRAGGAVDIVDDPATGLLLDRVDPESVAAAARQFPSRAFDPDACRVSAERFAEERFTAAIERVLAEELASE